MLTHENNQQFYQRTGAIIDDAAHLDTKSSHTCSRTCIRTGTRIFTRTCTRTCTRNSSHPQTTVYVGVKESLKTTKNKVKIVLFKK